MKRLFLISAAIGSVTLITVLFKPSVNHPAESSHPATVAGPVSTGDLPPGSAYLNNNTIDMFHYATAVHREMESETQELIEAIQAALRSDDVRRWDEVSQNQLRLLIQRDPSAAAGLALGLDPGPIREQMLRQIAQGWAAQDSAAALAWAAGLTDAGERNSVLTDACVGISQSNPAEAINTARQYGVEDKGGFYENMVEQWAVGDMTAALAWVAQFPAGAGRDGMMARVAFVEAQVSPGDAADLVVKEIPPGPAQDEAAMSVLGQWGLRDFTGASAWVDQFPAGPLADRAKQELAGIDAYRQALNH
jgi:hypothetical protein